MVSPASLIKSGWAMIVVAATAQGFHHGGTENTGKTLNLLCVLRASVVDLV